jgi:hypothetical protein
MVLNPIVNGSHDSIMVIVFRLEPEWCWVQLLAGVREFYCLENVEMYFLVD